ncbi:MAG: TrkA family potassium uptake protein [Clostridia bacterium]|nr:TrkA family potassium uptake protein [Clostridia bacterium]
MKSFAVIGLGRFGYSLATTLCKLGHEVLAVDIDEKPIRAIKSEVTHAVQANTTDEQTLYKLGIRNFDCVAICLGDDIRSSILTTVLCKDLGAKLIIAKASDDLHAKLLYKTGADKVIQPERDSGARLARSLTSDSIVDYLELSDEYSINEIRIPQNWVEKSLVELDVRTKFGISVIAIRRNDEIIVTIDPQKPLCENDILVIIGSNEQLAKVEKL